MSRVYDALMRVVEGSKLQEEKVHTSTFPRPKEKSTKYEAVTGGTEAPKSQEETVSSATVPPSKESTPLSLSDDLQELEKILLSRIARIASAVKQIDLVAAREVQQAQQMKEHFTAQMSTLEAQLKERDETIQAKDSVIISLISLKESLNSKIHDLENQVGEKGGLLQVRDAQIKDFQSQLEALMKRMNRMAPLLKQAEALAAIDEEEMDRRRG